ncbi:hypothetical protein ACA910_022623 [Epithemia clementina (nom. ined.)]
MKHPAQPPPRPDEDPRPPSSSSSSVFGSSSLSSSEATPLLVASTLLPPLKPQSPPPQQQLPLYHHGPANGHGKAALSSSSSWIAPSRVSNHYGPNGGLLTTSRSSSSAKDLHYNHKLKQQQQHHHHLDSDDDEEHPHLHKSGSHGNGILNGNGSASNGSSSITTNGGAGGRRGRRAKMAATSSGGNHAGSKIGTTTTTTAGKAAEQLLHSLIYAAVNVIIAVPGLYGYAAVIFNHAVFQPHRNALAKLVLFSSLVHQLGFLLFSSLSGFAIGTVQDAGLIFLSSMANTIANRMILQQQQQDGDGEINEKAIVSTTLVLLSAGTALLGFCLVVIGKLKLANVVAYLPMPVVGGYLAFIGYFCLQAGVALAISTPLVTFADWRFVFQGNHFLLALPALLTGVVLTLASRYSSHGGGGNAGTLPLCMIAIPTLFYVVMYLHFQFFTDHDDGEDDNDESHDFLQVAREHGWVGPVAPPTPVSDLWDLVEWDLVEWKLVGKILWTWVGMVFVVSFASCLDVAAISMDMGEALDTNRELSTVGFCNLMSGLTLGFTGSYIFSQTIFTYRTGVHTRWIGIFIMVMYLYFVISPMNLLQISPLFFLGSTLIFIGYDLMFEWLYEIRQRVLWSEYATIWGTFIAIQMVGVDAGILIGVLSAIVEHAVSNAQATTVLFVPKRSKAVWTKEEYQFLHERVYHAKAPKIVTLELMGPIFFGSSLSLIERLREEVSLPKNALDDKNSSQTAMQQQATPLLASIQNSPRTSSYFLTKDRRPSFFRQEAPPDTYSRPPPKYCVLDLTQVSNVDASSARSCFLQFCKMCNKYGMTVCASGATPRIAWMLRTHEAAYPLGEEEERIKARLHAMEQKSDDDITSSNMTTDRILLFHTTHEALEFCEASLIHQFHHQHSANSAIQRTPLSILRQPSLGGDGKLSTLLTRFLGGLSTTGLSQEEIEKILKRLDSQRYHSELTYQAGEKIMAQDTRPESFYVVLEGAVASGAANSQSVNRHRQPILSGAGPVNLFESSSYSNLLDALPLSLRGDGKNDEDGTSSSSSRRGEQSFRPVVGTVYPVGGVFGYTDLLLDRPRTFGAFAMQNQTIVARITRSNMNLLQQEDRELNGLLYQVLLRASLVDLANCTCHRV